MTENEAREAAYQAFVSAWGSTTPYSFENEEAASVNAAWCRFRFHNTDSRQDTLGQPDNRIFRRRASVLIDIYVPSNTGLSATDTLVAALRVIFEGITISGVRFGNSVFREIGPDGDSFRSEFEAFAEYDETK